MEQLTYTSCLAHHSVGGDPGMQIRALTPGLALARATAFKPLLDYELPAGTPPNTPPAEAPVRLAWLPTTEGGRALVHSVYAGADPNQPNRNGNIFSHLLCDLPEPFGAADAVALWGHDSWRRHDDGGGTRLEPAPPPRVPRGAVWEAARAFLSQPGAAAVLTATAAALARDATARAIVAAVPQFVAGLVAALVVVLPDGVGSGLTFSTYERSPGNSKARVVGTCFAPGAARAPLPPCRPDVDAVFNTFDPAPPRPQAGATAAAGAPAPGQAPLAYIEQAVRLLLAGDEAGLEDLTRFCAAAQPGEADLLQALHDLYERRRPGGAFPPAFPPASQLRRFSGEAAYRKALASLGEDAADRLLEACAAEPALAKSVLPCFALDARAPAFGQRLRKRWVSLTVDSLRRGSSAGVRCALEDLLPALTAGPAGPAGSNARDAAAPCEAANAAPDGGASQVPHAEIGPFLEPLEPDAADGDAAALLAGAMGEVAPGEVPWPVRGQILLSSPGLFESLCRSRRIDLAWLDVQAGELPELLNLRPPTWLAAVAAARLVRNHPSAFDAVAGVVARNERVALEWIGRLVAERKPDLASAAAAALYRVDPAQVGRWLASNAADAEVRTVLQVCCVTLEPETAVRMLRTTDLVSAPPAPELGRRLVAIVARLPAPDQLMDGGRVRANLAQLLRQDQPLASSGAGGLVGAWLDLFDILDHPGGVDVTGAAARVARLPEGMRPAAVARVIDAVGRSLALPGPDGQVPRERERRELNALFRDLAPLHGGDHGPFYFRVTKRLCQDPEFPRSPTVVSVLVHWALEIGERMQAPQYRQAMRDAADDLVVRAAETGKWAKGRKRLMPWPWRA